jgi:REP element-mobilizing transposase RayT
MAQKFQNKYRIPSTRLQNWDYGWNAPYFVTICTQNREYDFGNIVDGKMQLSEIGKLAEKYWHEIPQHFLFVKLDAFVVMPNHVHGIIVIDKPNDGHNDRHNDGHNDGRNDGCNDGRNDGCNVETQNFASLPPLLPPPSLIPPTPIIHPSSLSSSKNKFGPQSKNLGSIVRGYKIGVTKNARLIFADFAWQPRFYDHIIRNNESYQKIKTYIIENPLKWVDDKFYNQ